MVFLMERWSSEDIINIGAGETISIRGLAELLAQITGYRGAFRYDASKPDGMPKKQLNPGKLLALGWRPRMALAKGWR